MTSIAVLKEQEILETPLLLFECKLASGETERWSSHSVEYEGNSYASRVLRHNLFEVSAASEEGIDAVSKISISLANADSHFSQIDRGVGWKGSRLTVRFLFFDLKNGTAASESKVVFRGIANPPDEITETYLRLTFSNRLGLQRVLLPALRVQRRCPWLFPSNSEQRDEATDGGAKGRYSPFYACGYSAGSANGVGNLEGGEAFTSCDYTKASCKARGMFVQDSSGNPTRRFGGIEFLPASILVRSHGEQSAHASEAVANETRYNDVVPLIYGTAWYQPPVVFARNDGNLTRMEILLGSGEIQGLLKVLVNDVEIPMGQAGVNMTATGWYNLVTKGTRIGGFNLNFIDEAGNPLGDPYGSMAYASVVVPNQISDGRVLPRVQVLIEGLVLDQYDTNGDYWNTAFTNNPAWALLDVLRRCGWATEEIDLASFSRAASHCDELIDAFDLHGNPIQVARYQSNLVVRKRRSAADLVRGIRNASGLYVTYGEDGLLEAHPESTFAIQQSEKPEGSNSDEVFNDGWPVYEFGDGSTGFSGIARKENGEPSIRLWSRSAAETPNRYTVEFQDAFNEYQQDSMSLVDVDDVLLSGQEVTARLSALGIPNFSQAARIMCRQLDRGIRGNLFAEFETSVRAIGVKPGDLITLTYLKEGLQREPFRVVKVTAATNQHRLRIVCQKHDDAWYGDDAEGGSGEGRQPGAGVGLPRPLIGDVLDAEGNPQFEVTETPVELADGTMAVGLSVGFVPPAKPQASNARIPLLSLATTIATTGGTLNGDQTLYYAVSGVDSLGAEGPLSFIVRAAIPSGSDTNTVTLEGLSFSGGTDKFNVYRGRTPMQLHRIASNAAVSGSFMDTGLSTMLIGPPDENYDHARFYWRLEKVPEHNATIYSTNSIGSDLLEMDTNQHAGAVIRITAGSGAGQERSVISNDENSLTVTPKWEVAPDGTSTFVVAESGWHDGAAGVTSPVEFELPNL